MNIANWKGLVGTSILLVTSICYQVMADETSATETWRCFSIAEREAWMSLLSGISPEGKGTVQLTRPLTDPDVRKGWIAGEVSVAGIIRQAEFYIDGLDRRWDFGEHAFVVSPDGIGAYYDFSVEPDEPTAPQQIYRCVSP